MTRHKRASLPNRNLRLADQIQKDLAALIQREFDVARVGLVTLSRVELSVNYASAKVFFTVLGADPDVSAALLNEKAGWLHSQLYRLFHIHTVPTLRFFHDPQLERSIEMSRLIDEANRADAQRGYPAREPDVPDDAARIV